MIRAFFGCHRASEFCATASGFDEKSNSCLSGLTMISDRSAMYVHVKRHKADIQNCWFTLRIGCSYSSVCALCSMLSMISHRQWLGLPPELNVSKFLLPSGLHLVKSTFVVKSRLFLALVIPNPQEYSQHLFRAGSAKTAALVGLVDWEIQLLGQWVSTVYLRYIHAPTDLLLGFSNRLSQCMHISNPIPHHSYVANVISYKCHAIYHM